VASINKAKEYQVELTASRLIELAKLKAEIVDLEAEVEELSLENMRTYNKLVKLKAESVPQEEVNKLVECLDSTKKNFNIIAKMSNDLNKKIHGELGGCDCEGSCSCKPENWIKIETLECHCLGCEIMIDESIQSYQAWAEKNKLEKGEK